MYCLPLTEALDPTQVGGKTANLALAAQRGFPVPEGIVLPRHALRAFLDAHGLVPTLEATWAAYPALPWRDRVARFEALQAAVLALPVPGPLRFAVEPTMLGLLSRSPAGLAVRSSGLGEDLTAASFAGLYSSVLGVATLVSLWESVLRCWCSAWSPQVAAYAAKLGVVLPVDGMSVLVQVLIPADSSGVAFTADPLTGNPYHFVVNATPGLASRVLDGDAPADRYVLAWDTGAVLSHRIQSKPDAVVARDGRISRLPLPASEQDASSLSAPALREVGRLALAVDRAFDRRMDLEWAVASGRLYLVQARPLTALPPFFPHSLSPDEAEEPWTLCRYAPLHERERLVAPFYRGRSELELWRRFLVPGDPFPHPIGKERDFHGYRYATPRQWQGSSLDWPQVEPWLDEHEPRLRHDWLAQLERVRRMNAWLDGEIAGLSVCATAAASAWIRVALAYVHAETDMQAAVWYAPQWLIFTCEKLLAEFVSGAMAGCGLPDLPCALLQGLSCYSVQRAIAAQALGQEVHEEPVRAAFAERPLSQVLPFLYQRHPHSDFIRAWHAFCRAYGIEPPSPDGEHGDSGLDLGGLLMAIRAGIMAQGCDAAEMLAEAAARRQAVEAQALHWLSEHRPDDVQRFGKLLRWAQFWTPALDDRKWHLTMTLRRDQVVRLTGEALVAAGLIDEPAHFLLLAPEEWAAFVARPDTAALRGLYHQRRHEYEHDRRLQPPPYLGRPPSAAAGPPPPPQEEAAGSPQPRPAGQRILQGEGLAPGQARGIAYPVRNLDDPACLDNLTDRHIVICRRDTYNAQWRRDWYSLFMVARGLVTVQGAQLHHAAQIARECGVPLVNLPADELVALPTGTSIEVDGRLGTVTLLA